MYNYQCSKIECGSTWTLNEGKLNGFVLTCPICGKGRGMFISQTRRDVDKMKKSGGIEEMVISINSNSAKAVEELDIKIEEFVRNHSITLISKDIEAKENEVSCRLQYKI
jgi:hypothetical protein